jgi:hypothetical protein
MGWLSKAWKGVKGAVKKVVRTVKKTAKKIAYAVPGGKALWKLSTKIGEGAMKVVGKVVNKLGPVGMIALSVLAPYAAPLWASFGAAAAAAGGVMGSIGTAVFTAGNWVAGTLGAMSQGISNAIGTIAEGGLSGIANGTLSKAANQAVEGFASAFTGEAGKIGIQAGVQSATNFAIKEAAGQSLLDQTVGKMANDAMGSLGFKGQDQFLADAGSVSLDEAGNQMMSQSSVPQFDVMASQPGAIAAGPSSASVVPSYGEALNNATRLGGAKGIASTAVQNSVAKQTGKAVAGNSLVDGMTKVAKSLLAGDGQGAGQIQAYQPIGDVGGRKFSGSGQAAGGVGSGGGSFLTQQMLAAMQAQTQRMTRGFG